MAKKQRTGVHTKSNGRVGDCFAEPGKCPLLAEGSIHGRDEDDLYGKLRDLLNDNAFKPLSKSGHRNVSDSDNSETGNGALVYGYAPASTIVSPTDAMYEKDPYKNSTVYAPGAGREIHIYSYDDEYCDMNGPDGEDCGDSYCNHRNFRNVRISSETTMENYAKEYLGVDEIPEGLKPYINWTREDENFVVYSRGDYYGVYADVQPHPEILKRLDEIKYSMPNLTSNVGGYDFARMNGIDTSGKTEVEALKAVVNKNKVPSTLKSRIESANSFESKMVPLSQIRYKKTAMDKSVESSTKMRSARVNDPEKAVGVVIEDDNGNYVFVSGDYSRFKAAIKSNRKNMPLYVLKHDTKHQDGYRGYYERLDGVNNW